MLAVLAWAGPARGQTFFVDCGPYLPGVGNAIGDATALVALYTDYMTRGVQQHPQGYTTWFGTTDAQRLALVGRKFGAIGQRLGDMTVNCSGDAWDCENASAVAEAPATVHLCAAYWELPYEDPFNGTDQRTAFVHEVSHLPDVLATQNADPNGNAVFPALEQAWAQLQPAAAPYWAEAYQFASWWLPQFWHPSTFNCRLDGKAATGDAGAGLLPAAILLAIITSRARRRSRPMTRSLTILAAGLVAAAAFAVLAGSRGRRALPLDPTPLVGAPARADEAPDPEKLWPSAPDPRVRCELQAPRSVRLGEPLRVTMRLTNLTDAPLRFQQIGTLWDSPNWPALDIRRSGERIGHRTDRFAGKSRSPVRPEEYRSLAARATIETDRDVADWNEGGWIVDAPGRLVITKATPWLSDLYEGAGVDLERIRRHERAAARVECGSVAVDVLPAEAR